MNLDALRDYCGSLLDYDPINPTYTAELTSFLNDAQQRLLGDRPWSFLITEQVIKTRTDVSLRLSFTNGNASASVPAGGASLPIGTAALPGSEYELGTITVTDSNGSPVSMLCGLFRAQPCCTLTGRLRVQAVRTRSHSSAVMCICRLIPLRSWQCLTARWATLKKSAS